MAREIAVPAQTVTEDIVSLYEYPNKLVRAHVAYVTPEGEITNPNSVQAYDINGELFTDLMSANPAWAPNKPAGTYRNEDLWHFIDIIRSTQNA